MWRGVPSVAAIGPFGGRGVPSGRWALTLIHSLDSKLGAAVDVLDGGVAKEGGVERLGVVRSAGSLGGGSVTAVGPPTRGTAMLRWSHRLCAAVDQWGYYAGKTNSFSDSEKITLKKEIKSESHLKYSGKNKEKYSPGKHPDEGAVSGRAGAALRRLEKRRHPPPGEKKETTKQALTSLIAHRPEAHTHRLLPRRHAALARPPLLPRPRTGAQAERLVGHAACSARSPGKVYHFFAVGTEAEPNAVNV